MTRPSKFAPDLRHARLICIGPQRAARSPRHTPQRAHPRQCVSTSPADPPFSSVSAATRRAQPIAPQSRARLTQLAGPTVGTVPGDGSGQGRIGTPPQRLRHGYRRSISRTFGPGHGTSAPGRRGVSEELWTPNRRRNARLGARSPPANRSAAGPNKKGRTRSMFCGAGEDATERAAVRRTDRSRCSVSAVRTCSWMPADTSGRTAPKK